MRCALLLVGLVACSSEYPRETTCTVGERRACTCATGQPGFELCYDAVPSIWGACVCDGLPVADAGGDLDVPVHTTVQLNARRSSDPNHLELRYHWTLDSAPAGSIAMLQGDTTPDATFVADVEGTYELTLVVDDADVASAPTHVNVHASNQAPVVDAYVSSAVMTGTPAMLDASASTDVNSDPLTFVWGVVDRPAGSTALPADVNAATTTFTPDVDGDYQLSIGVSDGTTTSTVTRWLTSFHAMTLMPAPPRVVEYDRAHDRLLFVTDSAAALYVYTPATDVLATVALSHAPTNLTISPDGTRADVLDAGGLTIFNLTTMAVVTRHALTFTPEALVDPGDGWVYAFVSSQASDYHVRGIRVSNGAVTTGAQAFYGDMYARAMPGTTKIYATDQAFTEVFTYASGMTTLATSATPIGTKLWTTDDGTHVFTFGVTTYAADLTANGTLSRSEGSFSESSATGTLLAIPTSGTSADADESIDVYTYPALAFVRSVSLPRELANGTARLTHGRYVFLHADGVHFTVVAEAEPLFTQGHDWVIMNL